MQRPLVRDLRCSDASAFGRLSKAYDYDQSQDARVAAQQHVVSASPYAAAAAEDGSLLALRECSVPLFNATRTKSNSVIGGDSVGQAGQGKDVAGSEHGGDGLRVRYVRVVVEDGAGSKVGKEGRGRWRIYEMLLRRRSLR